MDLIEFVQFIVAWWDDPFGPLIGNADVAGRASAGAAAFGSDRQPLVADDLHDAVAFRSFKLVAAAVGQLQMDVYRLHLANHLRVSGLLRRVIESLRE